MNLLRVYVGNHGPLPNDEEQIFFLAGITDEGRKNNIRLLLKMPYLFRLEVDGCWHDDFADEMLDLAIKASEKQANTAKKGLEGRQRGSNGQLLPKVPRNPNPATAGVKPATADVTPAIQEPRANTQEPRSHTQELDSSSSKALLGDSSKEEDTPAPPKGKDKVGADRNGAIAQLQGRSPASSAPIPDWQRRVAENAARRRRDPSFGEGSVSTEEHAARQVRRLMAEGRAFE